MSNANRDYAIVYDVKNSLLVLSRPLIFYLTDKNTSNIFVKLVTKVIVGDGIDQYTDIENASSYVLTMRVIKPDDEVKSIIATQHESESVFQFDLTEDFKDVPGKYICELTISNIVNGRQEFTTSDPFNYEVKRSILSNVKNIIEGKDTTVEKLLNDLDATKAELSSQIKEKAKQTDLDVVNTKISQIVANSGDGNKDNEVIEAREGETSLGYKIRKLDKKAESNLKLKANIGKNLLNTTIYENFPFDNFNNTYIYLDVDVKLENNIYYKMLLYFTDGTFEDGTGSNCIYQNEDTEILSRPINNVVLFTSDAEKVNKIRFYFNPTGEANHAGKTIAYIMLIRNEESNDYERFHIDYESEKINGIDSNIDYINNKLNDMETSTYNIFDYNKSKVGYYVYNGDVRIYTDNSKSVSEMIEVTSDTVYSNLDEVVNCLAYDSDKNIIGGFQFQAFYNIKGNYPNAKYFVFCYTTENAKKIMISFSQSVFLKYVPNKQIKNNKLEIFNNNIINFWEGKIGDSLGDSLTEARFFQLHTANFLNLKKFYCHGIGGSKLSGDDVDASRPSMWKDSRIEQLNDNADFITILGGQNDGNVIIGDVSFDNTDTNTYVGALNVIISKIYAKYNGDIIIILCTPFYTPDWGNNMHIKNMAAAVRKVAELWGLPVADFGGLSGANPSTSDVYWDSDKIHPIEKFYKERLTPILVDTLNKIKPIDYTICDFIPRDINQNV